MAQMDDLKRALKKADEAGNEGDARKLADAIRKQRQKPQEPAKKGSRSDVADYGVGAGEMALSMATGAGAEVAGGLAGIGQGVLSAVRGDDDPIAQAADRVEQVQDTFTYQPRTEEGQQIAGKAGELYDRYYQQYVDKAGQETLEGMERTGSPTPVGDATLVQTAGEFLPAAIGVRGTRGRLKQRREDVRGVEGAAKDQGINLRERGEPQAEQIAAAGERMTGDITAKGQATPEIQRAVQRAREVANDEVNALYDEARSTRAGIKAGQMREFVPMAKKSLETYDVEGMPGIKRRLNELEKIQQMPGDVTVKLDALEKWRSRLNEKKTPVKTDAEKSALGILRGQLDNFVTSKFNADMISGDPSAISKWRNARGAFRHMKETFDANKTIRELARNEADPEEMRQWIFGASSVGGKKMAGDTVRRLKDIVGEDSPQFRALRQDGLIDVMEPLMQDKPNLRGFIKNYDKLVRGNETVAKELFGDRSLSALRHLRRFAKANVDRGKPPEKVPLSRMGAVAMFGHGMARQALKVNLARKIFDAAKNKSNKRAFMSEVLGYDPNKPLIPKSPAVIGGTTQTLQRQEEEQ